MSALRRTLLATLYGVAPNPADAEEVGRIFDQTPLHGLDRDCCEQCRVSL